MMIPRYVIIMRFPVISQTDLFPEAATAPESQPDLCFQGCRELAST